MEYSASGAWGVWPVVTSLRSLNNHCKTLVHIAGNKSDCLGIGLCQGCPLSQILLLIFMDRISRHSLVEECFHLGGLRILSLLFADDV